MPHSHLLRTVKRVAVEPFFVQDIYCDHLHSTELIGVELFRFVFTVEQKCAFTGEVENVIVAKLVVPRDMALQNTREATKAMGMTAGGVFGG